MADSDATILARLWHDWAGRLAALGEDALATPTRCEGWAVRDLAAHVAPEPDVLGGLESAVLAAPAAVDDAATLLRGFNRPGGVAHAFASAVADQARAMAAARSRDEIVASFTGSAEIVESIDLPPDSVLPHPVAGSVTAQVLIDVSLLEGVVHLLDLVAAVGGPPPAADALARVADLLVDVAGPAAFVEAACGRVACDGVLPAIR